MNIGRHAIAGNIKFYKRAMRRLDAWINLICVPLLLHRALDLVDIPAVFAAEVGILEAEATFIGVG